jgi:hypothetical protein
MTAFTGFLSEVMPYVPGCPQPMIINAIRNATIQLCQESSWYTYTPAAINVVATTSEYALTPPAGTLVSDILWAAYNDTPLEPKTEVQLDAVGSDWKNETGDPVYYTLLSPRSVRVVPTPVLALTSGLKLRYALKPTPTATTVDDTVFEEWHEAIAAGALARLLEIRDKPWTSLAEAERQLGVFLAGIQKAKTRAASSNIKRVSRSIVYGGIR